MDILTTQFLLALLTIIMIDLVLAGDNAIVIGMAARNLPKENQKKVIFWGIAGAIIIRIIATILVVQLLNVPWLMLIGGLVLIWISVKLLTENKKHEISAKSSVIGAIYTIIVADAAMGVDNVIAVAGAAHGSTLLVILGLLISIPIMVWGSTLLIRLINRFPSIVYIGAGILAFTAAKMITGEIFFKAYFEQHLIIKWSLVVFVVISVLIVGKWINYLSKKANQSPLNLPA